MAHELYQNAQFVKSAARLEHLPPDMGIEVAFAGRSNAGKSTLLNLITRQKGLAKTSNTPGRTQLINIFEFAPNKKLIDLPGYGFAKVPLAIKKNWQETLGLYLQKRECLKGLIVLMDARHPLKDLDWQLIQWAYEAELLFHCVLTKADKLSQSEKTKILKSTQEALKIRLSELPGDPTHRFPEVQLFSALVPPSQSGLTVLEKKLDSWFKN